MGQSLLEMKCCAGEGSDVPNRNQMRKRRRLSMRSSSEASEEYVGGALCQVNP